MTRLVFDAIGTKWETDIHDPIGDKDKSILLKKIKQTTDQYDKIYSRFRTDSVVWKINEDAGSYQLPEHSNELFALYRDLYEISNGLFTPLVGCLLSDLGYDKDYSLKQKSHISETKKWVDVMTYSKNNLSVKEPLLIDVGAAGKGQLIDIVSSQLQRYGLSNFCVEAGGDMFYSNTHKEKLRVGLEHPLRSGEVVGVAEILNESICGSAGNRRKWGKYHHIINPKTQTSDSFILATWVVAQKTMIADALATCLFLVPADILEDTYVFEYALVKKDLSLEHSKNFPADFF